MRLAFFGTAEFAGPTLRALAAAGHEIACVVTQPDRPRGRSKRPAPPPLKEVALELGLAPILQPERMRAAEARGAFEAQGPFDVAIVVAYGQILSESVLAIPRDGMLNVHASLLPRWRGAAPVQHAVWAGDETTGVCVQRMVKALDAGPVLASHEVPIGPDDTSESLLASLAEDGARLVTALLPRLLRGEVVERPQDPARVTFAPTIQKDAGLIDWARPAGAIERQTRALKPWPGTFTSVHAAHAEGAAPRLGVEAASVVEPAPRGARDASPGTILSADAGGVVIAAGDGTALRLTVVKPAGRRAMPADAWWRGRPAVAGDRLG